MARSLAAIAVLGVVLGLPGRSPAAARSLMASDAAEFRAAVAALGRSGGTIELGAGDYGRLVVSGARDQPLRVLARGRVRVERLVIDHADHVSFGGLVVAPGSGPAVIEVRGSRHVDLHDLVVTAAGTPYSASVFIPDSSFVTIRRSRFSHCGDRSPAFVNCVLLYRWARQITLEGNWFHDCYGCDFVHGRFGSDLVIRRNRLERALPCRIGRIRCGHQDLVELFAGQRLRVAGNEFGVYRIGGAQLFLTEAVDHVTIVNNVFRGTDPRVPGYAARIGMVIGSGGSRRLPHYVRVANNTVLTGYVRRDRYLGSIRMSSRYGGLPRAMRPLLANNVFAYLTQRRFVCSEVQRSVTNVVLHGEACSDSDVVDETAVDARGRPTAGSSAVIDAATARYAPRVDFTGRPRVGAPDIGAFEFRGG